MRVHKLTFKVLLLIFTIDAMESVGELFMKEGLNRAGIFTVTAANIVSNIVSAASSYLIWAGVLIYILNFFILIAVLSRIQLSVAFPVGSTSFIYVPILALIFLGESISPLRWAGIALIILGINFASRSTQVEEHISP